MGQQLTVQLSEDVARTLHHRTIPTAAAKDLFEITQELGIILQPLHPGAEDPLLMPYFIAELPDTLNPDLVVTQLQKASAVEAAYFKPTDESP